MDVSEGRDKFIIKNIMNKILGILTLLVILPLSIYQFLSKNKQEIDKTISFIAVGIISPTSNILTTGEGNNVCLAY